MSKMETVVVVSRGVAVWLGVIFPTLLFIAVALTASSDVLTKNPELAALCQSMQQLMAAWFPKIDFFRHARSTRFPEVATFTTAYACAWWLWMTTAIAVLSLANHRMVRAINRESGGKRLPAFVVFGPPFGLFCFWAFFALPGDPSSHAGLTTDGRLGYAFMGTLAVLFASLPLGFLPVNLLSLFADVIFTGGKKQPRYLR